MAKKKSFVFDNPKAPGEEKTTPAFQTLSLLAKHADEAVDIFEINMNFNKQVVGILVDLFGPNWRYRAIKETAELTGVNLKHGQLKLFSQGKSFHQQNLFALLILIAHHKEGLNITISEDKQIIINS